MPNYIKKYGKNYYFEIRSKKSSYDKDITKDVTRTFNENPFFSSYTQNEV